MDKCVYCKRPFGLVQPRVLVNWRKRRGEKRIVLAHACENCGDDNITDLCQIVRPVFK